MEYSVVKDAAFCFICQLFSTGPGHEKSNDVWFVEGVCQWNKMKNRGKSKQGKLSSHFGSYGHKALLEALVAFQEKFQRIGRMMDKEHAKLLKLKQRREIEKLLRFLCALPGRQGLSLPGHRAESDANGNLI